MLFFIALGVLIIGIVLLVLREHYVFRSVALENTGITFTVLGAFAVIICLVFLSVCYFGINGRVALNNQRYEILTYQYENNLYDNDNDLGKKELINQIQEWNEDLAWYKANQKDLWIGIFIPNVFDQFEFIDLE